jgi:UDP-N-acetylglucosamine:LPS N-acetylglucosamine transferase
MILEQGNLTPHLLVAEIERLFTNPKARVDLAEAAAKFAKKDAAKVIANALIDTAVAHDS